MAPCLRWNLRDGAYTYFMTYRCPTLKAVAKRSAAQQVGASVSTARRLSALVASATRGRNGLAGRSRPWDRERSDG
jgi:hypothetical protein